MPKALSILFEDTEDLMGGSNSKQARVIQNENGISKIEDIIKLLLNPTELSCFIAGVLSRDIAQHTLMAGRIVEAARKYQMLKQLGQEIRTLIDTGKLKEDCFVSSSNQAALLDLLQLIDREIPDDIKFNAVKAIFSYSLGESLAEQDKLLAYELQKICSRMSSGELVVLKATYEIRTGKNLRNYPGGMNLSIAHVAEWLKYVAFQVGHNDSSLVELHEENLMKLKLISDRVNADRRGIIDNNFRLTSLGIKLCDLIIKF